MFKLLAAILLPMLFLSFAIALAQQGNVTGISFQLIALHQAPDVHTNNSSSHATEDLNLPITTSARFIYGVFVSIGTGEGTRRKVLALDTGANTSWLMCEPCQPPLPQVGHLFSPAASPTFRGVHGDDPVCTTPYRHTAKGCSFRFPFAAGYLSRDTFHLRSGGSGTVMESVPGIVFSCAHSVTGFHNDGTLGEVLSLSHSPLSFLTLLGARASGRFSYCLPKPTAHSPHSFLRFGADVPSLPSHAHTTTLVHAGIPRYHLNIVGISLGNKRLHIDRDVFAAGGGCSINPAVTITRIVEPAYLAVEHALVAHMKELGSGRVKGMPGGPLCFDHMGRSVRAQLPGMSFHFEDGVELHFAAEQLFDVRVMAACFLVVGAPPDGDWCRTAGGHTVHIRCRCW